jgi:hypothetical protein
MSENVPPFGASTIDVVEMVEVGGIFEIAERRDAVRLGRASRMRGAGTRSQGAERAAGTQGQHMPA